MKYLLQLIAILFLSIGSLNAQNLNLHNDAFEIDASIQSYLDSNKDKPLEKAKRTCFCVVSYDNLSHKKKRSGVCLDLTSRVNHQYNGMSPHNQRSCNQRCTNVAKKLTATDLKKIASCACSKGVPNRRDINAYSALSVKKYRSAHGIGILENIGAQTKEECDCPKGWAFDTTHKKCKKKQCQLSTPSPNQSLGNWGFIWNNTIWQWMKANCKTITVKPGVCRIKKY